jgi:hypothetical protein
MAKVYLYEDSGGSLYVHQQDASTVYANVEIMVPYGATFEQDASEIADGRSATSDGLLKVPFAEFEPRMLEGEVRRIAVWDDGRIQRFGQPGRDGLQYLQSPRELNPDFDNANRATL